MPRIEAIGSGNNKEELTRAVAKGALMQEVFNLKLLIRRAKVLAIPAKLEGRSDASHTLRKKYSVSG
jgi:hypothetical protein